MLPVLRTSERTTFKRCPIRWWWSYREGLTPQGPPNKNLWFGTGIHLSLSNWYGEGTERLIDPRKTWEEWSKDEIRRIRVYAERFEADEAVYVEAAELGHIILDEYLKEYGKDERWHFIATEMSGQVKIPLPDGTYVIYAYTIDGVFRDLETDLVWLLETKTGGTISTGHLPLDDQAGSYWAISTTDLRKRGVLGPKEHIAGVMYNFLRKTLPDDRPKHPVTGERCNKPTKEHYINALRSKGLEPPRTAKLEDLQYLAWREELTVVGDVSKNQPTPMFLRERVYRTRAERKRQIQRIADEATVMAAFRSGTLPIIKTPRSTGHDACQHGCEFYEMCTLHENGGDWETFRDAMYRVEDPYVDHRKSAHTGG